MFLQIWVFSIKCCVCARRNDYQVVWWIPMHETVLSVRDLVRKYEMGWMQKFVIFADFVAMVSADASQTVQRHRLPFWHSRTVIYFAAKGCRHFRRISLDYGHFRTVHSCRCLALRQCRLSNLSNSSLTSLRSFTDLKDYGNLIADWNGRIVVVLCHSGLELA